MIIMLITTTKTPLFVFIIYPRRSRIAFYITV